MFLQKRKIVCFKIFLFILIVLTACKGTSTETSEADNSPSVTDKDKVISIGIIQAPGSLNPIDRTDWASYNITNLLFNPLMHLDEDFNLIHMLADEITTEDNQLFTVKLNPDITWTDGKLVTADDVLFCLKMITHPEVSSLFSSNFGIIEGLEANGKFENGVFEDLPGVNKIDDHTIEFRTKTPVDPMVFHEKISFNIKAIPKHILEDVEPSILHQHEFFQNPTVSYGAFKLISYQKGQYLELEANKNYYKGAPKLDKLYFKIMPSSNLVAQLQNGEIDMNFPEFGAIAQQDVDTVKSLSHIKSYEGLPLNEKFIGFNNERITDRKIRQAFAYAINREMLINTLLDGAGEISNIPYSPIHPYYSNEFNDLYPYDPSKAKELLLEAGRDSIQSFELIVPAGDSTMEQAADIIAANLKEVGVDIQINKLDMASAVGSLRSGDFDLFMWSNRFKLDPDLTQIFGTGSSINFTKYSNPSADAALEKGLSATDPEERKKHYRDFQKIFAEDLPQITLYMDQRLRAVNNRVINGEPKDIDMLANIHEWDVDN